VSILVLIFKKKCCVIRAFLWEHMCESVPITLSVKKNKDQLCPNKQRGKRKQTLEIVFHEQNLPGSRAELSCPPRHLWDLADPGVTAWSPAPEQLFIKADRSGGARPDQGGVKDMLSHRL
jgi:hypothetical protein